MICRILLRVSITSPDEVEVHRAGIWRWFGGAVFFDTGTVTESVGDLAPQELRSGVGAGVTLTTPVGPIRLDAGYPLDRLPDQDQKLRFYVTVGHPF